MQTLDLHSFQNSQEAKGKDFEDKFSFLLKKDVAKKTEPEKKENESAVQEETQPELSEEQEKEDNKIRAEYPQAAFPWLALHEAALQSVPAPCTEDGAERLAMAAVDGTFPKAFAEGMDGGANQNAAGQEEIQHIVPDLQQQPLAEAGKDVLIMQEKMKRTGTDVSSELSSRYTLHNEPLDGSEVKSEGSSLSSAFMTEEKEEMREPEQNENQGEISAYPHFDGKIQGTDRNSSERLSEKTTSKTMFSERHFGETIRMHTSERTLVQDTAQMLASRTLLKEGILELELEPVSLGKLTIQVAFESGKTAVTVMSSNSDTLDILSKNAAEIARILEDRTGQQTIIYTPETSDNGGMPGEEKKGQKEHRQNPEKRRQEQGESFAQQLRLGLI